MTEPRVLIWDLETGGVNAFYADLGFILNFGYKWLGEEETHILRVSDYRGWFKRERDCPIDDKPLIKEALEIMSQADVLVAHYGDKFDRKFFQGRCAIHDLKPPPPTIQRDTCLLAWKYFKFRSNRLAALANHFNLDEHKYEKKRNEWPGWWLRAMAGSKTAIEEMGEYCKQDVRTTEGVYLRIRPYDQAHPRLHGPIEKCRHCGGKMEYSGYRVTLQKRYRRTRCSECGAYDKENMPIKVWFKRAVRLEAKAK